MSGTGTHTVHADIALTLSGRPVQLRLGVPKGKARTQDLLPALRTLTDANVDAAARRSVERGQPISCRKGCSACCRQLVPITPAEAHRLAAVVAAMPAARRHQVQARFDDACERFAQTGMLDRLRHAPPHDDTARRQLGLDYFRHGVACPFLRDESCSIYSERPLACREYLVTSPVSQCSDPRGDAVDCVPMPVRVSRAYGQLQADREHTAPGWLPLVLALDWAGKRTQPSRTMRGPALLEALFALLGARRPVATERADTPPQ